MSSDEGSQSVFKNFNERGRRPLLTSNQIGNFKSNSNHPLLSLEEYMKLIPAKTTVRSIAPAILPTSIQTPTPTKEIKTKVKSEKNQKDTNNEKTNKTISKAPKKPKKGKAPGYTQFNMPIELIENNGKN